MQLIIYVHDFSRRIGHSRAMIEVIDQIKPENVKVVCYSHDPLDEINIQTEINYKFIIVPFTKLKPFLFRNLFFQVYTSLFESTWKEQGDTSISIGVCSFRGDIINIQFAHFLWEKLYFKASPVSWYKGLYKKVLLKYLTFCEDYCYQQEGKKFVFLSKFIQEAMVKRYQLQKKNFTLAYSSANTKQFSPSHKGRENAFNSLIKAHPELSKIDSSKPCILFVGAFERKGLPLFINKVPSTHELIVVGQAEKGSSFRIPNKENIHHVKFSTEIHLFYEACDTFVFPTIFEPFGLVLLEAALSGMNIITGKESVGASELLLHLPGIEFCNPFEIKMELLEKTGILNEDLREDYAKKRNKALSETTWETCAKEWKNLLP
jgi:glycosyltransferase involved in cell wall biosynthesis